MSSLETFSLIATVATTHFLALLSPGPDFILVVKSGIRNKKNKALGIAAGIAFANAVYIALCIVGVGEFLTQSLWLMRILKLLGGIFLCYIALTALKTKKEDYQFLKNLNVSLENHEGSFFREWMTGFISGISNPKNLIFYLSLFSIILTDKTSLALRIALGIWMTSLVFLWDALIIFTLSQPKIQTFFSRIIFYLDKVTGVILGGLGIKLIHSSITEDSL